MQFGETTGWIHVHHTILTLLADATAFERNRRSARYTVGVRTSYTALMFTALAPF